MTKPSQLLQAGIDYPRDWEEFVTWFHDEAACLSFLINLRWPSGFICPHCAAIKFYQVDSKLFLCANCRKKTSVTSGTIFDKSRISLRSWFAAVWYITNQKSGVSALGVKRLLELGSYQTAWSILHKLRAAMVNPERDKLSGIVEVDETLIGGVSHKDKSTEHLYENKAIVLVAVELIEPKGFGRIRLRQVDSATAENIQKFILDTVEQGSLICSDGSLAYIKLGKLGYKHKRIVLSGSRKPAHVSMAGVHRVSALLKRWLLGTYQGAVRAKQLDYYLDEYTFRFNRRKSNSRGLLFYRLLEQAMITKPLTYRAIKERR